MLLALLLTALASPGALVLVGGGPTPEEAYRVALERAGERREVVVLAHAARDPFAAGERSARPWRERGARVTVLGNLSDEKAERAFATGTIFWMPGGDQARLVEALRSAGRDRDLRRARARGAVVGGTSAGAAAAGEIMIVGDPPNPGGDVPLGEGLGLWPEAIVDQHFSERGRAARLREALRRHPGRIGIGLDEGTGVILHAGRLRAFGAGRVHVIGGTGRSPIERALAPGEEVPWPP